MQRFLQISADCISYDRLILSLTKIDNNGIYNYFIIRNLSFIIPIMMFRDLV
ncbi:protein of unknown function [Chryseobacterium sp. JV274]|nr:protein of unknown function [Chryseobacterium sp. JV274]